MSFSSLGLAAKANPTDLVPVIQGGVAGQSNGTLRNAQLSTIFGDISGSNAIVGLTYYGTWNASTNSASLLNGTTPALASGNGAPVGGTTGGFLTVVVAGNTSIDNQGPWVVGDTISWGGSAWVKIPVGGLSQAWAAQGATQLSFSTIGVLTAFNPALLLSGKVVATVQGYNTPGDNGGGVFDLLATSRTADNVVAFSVSGQSGFKWIRRYDLGALTFEMAGAVGDYSFVTDTGTDNAPAFNAFFAAFGQAAYTAGVIGNGGIAANLRPGCSYLLRSIPTMCNYVHIQGRGSNRTNPTQHSSYPQWLNAGSAIVLDVANGATYLAPFGEAHFENFSIIRRGIPLSPTGTQCIDYYGSSGGTWNDGSYAVKADGSGGGETLNGAHVTLTRMNFIGFGIAYLAKAVTLDSYDCIGDCYNGPEYTSIGDRTYQRNYRNRPQLGEAVPSSDPNYSTCRQHAGLGLNIHDKVDTFDSDGYASENWATIAQFSNLSTAPKLENFGGECSGNAGDIGISVINWVEGLILQTGNLAAATPLYINAVQWDYASPQPPEGATKNQSQVEAYDLTLISENTAGPMISIGGDACATRIRRCMLYTNGADLLHVAAKVSGRTALPCIDIADIQIAQPASNLTILVDQTIAPYTLLDNILIGAATNSPSKFVVPPGNTVPRLGTTGPISGRWYGPAIAYTTLTPTGGRLFAFPMPVGSVSQIVNLAINVTVTTGGSARFGIYSDNYGVPGALLYDSGAVAISATGPVSPGTAPAITPCTSAYAWFAIAVTSTDTPTISGFAVASAIAGQNLLTGANSLANAVASDWLGGHYSGSYSDGTLATALPASFGTTSPAGATVPAVWAGF